MACCPNPDPRILESNGRLFCHSCRRYLDAPPVEAQASEPDLQSETSPKEKEEPAS